MHMRKVCQYGYTHTQCRCPSPDKKVVTIQCDSPGAHAPKPEPVKTSISGPTIVGQWDDEVVDFLTEKNDLPTRLDNVLEHHLWWMKDDARMALIRDLMEQINQT